MVFVYNENNPAYQFGGYILDIIGIIVGIWLSSSAPTEMLNFTEIYTDAINKIRTVELTQNDFNFRNFDKKDINNIDNTLDN
jgi:hypothetical protein